MARKKRRGSASRDVQKRPAVVKLTRLGIEVAVDALLSRIPPELDDWLDRPARVACWVSDFGRTLRITAKLDDAVSKSIRALMCESLTQTPAHWLIITGSAVGKRGPKGEVMSADIEPWLAPLEEAVRSVQPRALEHLCVLGAVGQQQVTYNERGERLLRGLSPIPAFTDEEQLSIFKLWLRLFVDRYPAPPSKADQAAWRRRIRDASHPKELERMALDIGRVWGISRLEISRRGVDPESGLLSSERPATLGIALPTDGSLHWLAEKLSKKFDDAIRPHVPDVKPNLVGDTHVTVSFSSKEEGVLRAYAQVKTVVLSDGVVLMLGDDPRSDTFFRLTSGQLGRPVLKVLVDSAKATPDYPDLLLSTGRHLLGAQETIRMFLDAERNGCTYRNLPVFQTTFSIADVERDLGQDWKALRAAESLRRDPGSAGHAR